MAKKAKKPIKIGDLVHFDKVRRIGLVLDKKVAEAFNPEEEVTDIKVLWGNGDVFWCLDFTLQSISRLKY
jgi:hypothetical protein